VDERRPGVEPERRPVELVVPHEPRVVGPAPAGELDAVDGGVLRARELLQPPEPGQPHARVPVPRARERVGGGERVVHLWVSYRKPRTEKQALLSPPPSTRPAAGRIRRRRPR